MPTATPTVDPRTPDIIVTPNVGVTYSSSTAKQVFTAFVLAAEVLERLTVGRERRAIEDMPDFLPQTASVLRERPDRLRVHTDDPSRRDRPDPSWEPHSRRWPGGQ